jgi:iron complex outermembrane receptor protein
MKTDISSLRLSALAFLLSAPVVFAQTSTPIESGTLQVVVVSATRIDQLVMSAPIGSSVLTGDDILRSGVTDANEAIRHLAGIFGRRDLNGGRESSIDIRGYGDSASSNVVVLVDGIRISENDLESARLSSISSETIDRIEITRGGSAVLWGQGATGGVIHVITKTSKSIDAVHGEVSGGVESFGGYDIGGSINADSKNVSVFANGKNYHSDGYRKNNAYTGSAVNAGVVFGELSALKTKIVVNSEYLDMRWAGALPVEKFLVDATATDTPRDYGNSKLDRVVFTAEKKWSDINFAIDFAQRKRTTEGKIYDTFDGITNNQSDTTTYQLSPRFVIDKSFGRFVVNTVTGLDFYKWAYIGNRTYESPLPGWSSIRLEEGDQSSQAAYLRLSLMDQSGFRFDTGFRSESFKQTIANKSNGTSFNSSPDLNAMELGISYALNPQWTAYTRGSSSYRVANVDELRYLTSVLLPQKTNDAELGLRYRTIESTLDVRVFQQNTTNEIAYDNSLMLNINLDPVRRNGFEMNGSFGLSSRFKVGATLQSLDARVASGQYSGNRLPLTAASVATARLEFTPDSKTSLDLALRAVGAMKFGNDWTNSCKDISASEFIDVAYRYRSALTNGWSLKAGIDNLANKQSYSTGYTDSTCSAFNVYSDVGRKLKLNATLTF